MTRILAGVSLSIPSNGSVGAFLRTGGAGEIATPACRSTTNCAKLFTKMFPISGRLRIACLAMRHAFSASAFLPWG
jgi:hypothetical protein